MVIWVPIVGYAGIGIGCLPNSLRNHGAHANISKPLLSYQHRREFRRLMRRWFDNNVQSSRALIPLRILESPYKLISLQSRGPQPRQTFLQPSAGNSQAATLEFPRMLSGPTPNNRALSVSTPTKRTPRFPKLRQIDPLWGILVFSGSVVLCPGQFGPRFQV